MTPRAIGDPVMSIQDLVGPSGRQRAAGRLRSCPQHLLAGSAQRRNLYASHQRGAFACGSRARMWSAMSAIAIIFLITIATC